MKVAVVYWSGTGNTEKMAEMITKAAEAAGAQVECSSVDAFSAERVDEFDRLALGCAAMGDEVLEEDEFQPFYDEAKTRLAAKELALFGSYGWGDGQWMRDWEEDLKSLNAKFVCDYVICNDEPDAEAEAALTAMGQALAE